METIKLHLAPEKRDSSFNEIGDALTALVLKAVTDPLTSITEKEYRSEAFQVGVGGETNKSWIQGINPARIIRSGEWTLVAEAFGGFNGFFRLYKKDNVYIILDGRGLGSDVWISHEHVYIVKAPEKIDIQFELENLNHNFSGTRWSNFRIQNGRLIADHRGELHDALGNGRINVYDGFVTCAVIVPTEYRKTKYKLQGDWQDEAQHAIEFSVL